MKFTASRRSSRAPSHHALTSAERLRPWILACAVAHAAWMPLVAGAQAVPVRIQMDWLIQGTHAPFLLAQSRGYFKASGLDVSIDPGRGSPATSVSVAGGAYQFGWVDLPMMVRFNAQNPSTPLVAVYVGFDDTPLAIVSRKSAGIRKVADLAGRKVVGGPGNAVYDTFGQFLSAARAPGTAPNWVPLAPPLFGPMLAQGQVDALGGFTNSVIPAVLEAGLKREDLSVLRYRDVGIDAYGLALVTTQAYARQHPDTVKAVVAALNRGLRDTLARPDDALQALKQRDPLANLDIERERLALALELVRTPNTTAHGLSTVTPERLKRTVALALSSDDKAATTLDVAQLYTDRFLPPAAERAVPVAR